ncbi:MAG: hypothetical protein WAL45_03960 [Terracidiphilus sp.]
MAIFSTHASALGFSTEQTAAILSELDAIQTGTSFSGSKRCHDFLEFIVKHALEGNYEHLTERFLGVELFGRPVDYETATDAIVRVRANDVRRRLAQHYSTQNPVSGVMIGMAAGNYIPEFHWSAPETPETSEPVHTGHLPMLQDASPPSLSSRLTTARRLIKPIPITVALLILAGIVWVIWVRQTSRPVRALDQFWQPVFQSKNPVTIRFGETITYWISSDLRKAVEAGDPTISVKPGDIIESWDDSASAGSIRTVLAIANLLSSHGVATRLRWPREIQEPELEHSDVIYVGAFNNSWTVSLNRNLRFTFEESDTSLGHIWMIRDHNYPDRKWAMLKTYPQPIDHEYALITRILDPDRKRVVISLGGLNQFGSQAAAEFLTDEAAMAEFARNAPKGWEKRNLQIVMEMEISNNRAVNPRVIATNVW